ncbi:hypothetical protein Nepgr_033897 [Nepenthes gracilis]|uniref:Uncharacterized protein n=1 Tax=Nepenthes gracilis TaxID=150966 RepID=A0AAD3Y7A2_NEPGR|nr:hypothetical protein Nepgr_033897 [Nepenthes gracilis]
MVFRLEFRVSLFWNLWRDAYRPKLLRHPRNTKELLLPQVRVIEIGCSGGQAGGFGSGATLCWPMTLDEHFCPAGLCGGGRSNVARCQFSPGLSRLPMLPN